MHKSDELDISKISSPTGGGREGAPGVVLPTSYFGPVQWYRELFRCTGQCVKIEAWESYRKQTFRNRCTIATANGAQNLTVPVSHKGVRCIRDIEISDHGNWRHLHWQALLTSYGESAFFEYYQDDIRPFYERRWKYLLDYDMEITETICRLLDLDVQLRRTEQFMGGQEELSSSPQKTYYQVYRERNGFLPNLSILDLLFNEGPQSVLFLV